MKMDEGMKEMCAFINECCKNIVAGRSERWENIAPKIENENEREIIGALIFRMMAFATSAMRNANGLNWQVAPLVLRAMAECHINLFWMLAEPNGKNIRLYVKYGLEEMEKKLSYPVPEGMSKSALEMIAEGPKIAECHIKQQNKYLGNDFYEKGSKTKKVHVSEKARVIGEKKFYETFYATFCSAVHSSWLETNIYKNMLDFKEWEVERDIHKIERAWILYFGQAMVSLVSYSWERLDKEFEVECKTQIPWRFWLQHLPESSVMFDKRFNG